MKKVILEGGYYPRFYRTAYINRSYAHIMYPIGIHLLVQMWRRIQYSSGNSKFMMVTLDEWNAHWLSGKQVGLKDADNKSANKAREEAFKQIKKETRERYEALRTKDI